MKGKRNMRRDRRERRIEEREREKKGAVKPTSLSSIYIGSSAWASRTLSTVSGSLKVTKPNPLKA